MAFDAIGALIFAIYTTYRLCDIIYGKKEERME